MVETVRWGDKEFTVTFVWQTGLFVDTAQIWIYFQIVKHGSGIAFCVLIIATLACAASWDDDSYYVSLGPRNGYYIVRPDSHLFYQLGLYEAPVIDTGDPLHHGYGADALAFRFNRNGVLIVPPAYIAQALPYDFYKVRIGSLARGRATVNDVEALFGRGHSRAERSDGFMWYYPLPVYNPFEERGGRR